MVVPHIRRFDKDTYEQYAFQKKHTNAKVSPTTGAEPHWNPKLWNQVEKILAHHNCYSYATDTLSYHRDGKAQPGYFSGQDGTPEDQYHCLSFVERIKRDNPSFVLTTFGAKCPPGFHKAFLAVDNKKGDVDYHFYRQDKDGNWSHKPGRTEATRLDAQGKNIKNPLTADRKYPGYQYVLPCFFFCVEKGLARTSSQEVPSSIQKQTQKNSKGGGKSRGGSTQRKKTHRTKK